MLNEVTVDRVYLARGVTDVQISPNLYVFCNRKRDKMKILVWDKNGFWLYYRRRFILIKLQIVCPLFHVQQPL